MNPIIYASNVSVVYKKGLNQLKAIESVEMSVNRGELICIVGPSGCGKSTFLRALVGLEQITHGHIEIDKECAGRGIGYVPQDPQLLPWRTLLQNTFISSELRTTYTNVSVERVRSMINNYRLRGFENSYPHELSGGMKQRASLIRALQSTPAILFCDEPFSAVDFVSRFEFNTSFRTECKVNMITCVLVTHNIEEAIYLSDRILLMGGAPGTIIKEYQSRELPDRHDAVLCRQSNMFNDFFNEIWADLKTAYASNESF